nr:MAG TPA: hypothetical protein [Bacteriophage sp.]
MRALSSPFPYLHIHYTLYCILCQQFCVHFLN